MNTMSISVMNSQWHTKLRFLLKSQSFLTFFFIMYRNIRTTNFNQNWMNMKHENWSMYVRTSNIKTSNKSKPRTNQWSGILNIPSLQLYLFCCKMWAKTKKASLNIFKRIIHMAPMCGLKMTPIITYVC